MKRLLSIEQLGVKRGVNDVKSRACMGEPYEDQKPITAKDTEMVVAIGTGLDFKGADDGYFYATLRNGNVREVVKVVGRIGDKFTVSEGRMWCYPTNVPERGLR